MYYLDTGPDGACDPPVGAAAVLVSAIAMWPLFLFDGCCVEMSND